MAGKPRIPTPWSVTAHPGSRTFSDVKVPAARGGAQGDEVFSSCPVSFFSLGLLAEVQIASVPHPQRRVALPA